MTISEQMTRQIERIEAEGIDDEDVRVVVRTLREAMTPLVALWEEEARKDNGGATILVVNTMLRGIAHILASQTRPGFEGTVANEALNSFANYLAEALVESRAAREGHQHAKH